MDFAIAGFVLSTLILVVSCLGTGRGYYRDAMNPEPRNFTNGDIDILAEQVIEKYLDNIARNSALVNKIAIAVTNDNTFNIVFKNLLYDAVKENLEEKDHSALIGQGAEESN